MSARRRPGEIRDAILEALRATGGEASVREIHRGVAERIGDVSASSVRSYLNLNTPSQFERVARGRYRLKP